MTEHHDVMRGSHAWERLQHGIPVEVQPGELRRWMHDWVSVATVLVATVNDLLDEVDRLHERIDRRAEDMNALGKATDQRDRALESRLFDSEDGVLPTLAKRSDVARLTTLLWGVLVSVATAAIMLALNLVAKGG